MGAAAAIAFLAVAAVATAAVVPAVAPAIATIAPTITPARNNYAGRITCQACTVTTAQELRRRLLRTRCRAYITAAHLHRHINSPQGLRLAHIHRLGPVALRHAPLRLATLSPATIGPTTASCAATGPPTSPHHVVSAADAAFSAAAIAGSVLATAAASGAALREHRCGAAVCEPPVRLENWRLQFWHVRTTGVRSGVPGQRLRCRHRRSCGRCNRCWLRRHGLGIRHVCVGRTRREAACDEGMCTSVATST